MRLASSAAVNRARCADGIAAPGRILGANDRIRLGFIGCGMQFNALLARGFEPRRKALGDFDYVAVSDVWQPRLDYARQQTGAEATHRDYRDVLRRQDIDGVVIAVPDHWHFRIAREALLAGKDVYLEKPMTYTVQEAADLHDLAPRTGRMLQVGGGGVNAPLHWRIHDYIHSGRMGKTGKDEPSPSTRPRARSSIEPRHGRHSPRRAPDAAPALAGAVSQRRGQQHLFVVPAGRRDHDHRLAAGASLLKHPRRAGCRLDNAERQAS